MVQFAKPLNPFIVFCQKTIPLAFDESMSFMEAIYALKAYLENEIIPTVNTNAQAVTDLTNLVNQLQDYIEHYFDNLDVQEEINNKLDAMAEAGTLQEIIGEYLNATAIWGFDTVSSMKSSANLINGSFARTLGYYAKNDKGSALYKIRTITNDDVVDEKFILEMTNDNSLIAELIVTDTISPEQIGAKRNQTNDDAPYIQDCITYSKANGVKVTFGNNIYYVKSSLNIPEFYSIAFENITLQAIDTIAEGMINVKNIPVNKHHGVISNVILDQNNYAHAGIYVYHAYRRVFENILVKNTPATGYGILVDTPNNTTSGGNQFTHITGDGAYIGATFICDLVADNVYNNCDYRQYTVGFECGRFSRVYDFHGYIANVDEDDWYTNSIFIKIDSNGLLFADNLYPDTQNYIFHNSSSLPSHIGSVFYTHNPDTTQTSSIKFFYSTSDALKDQIFYRWRVTSLTLNVPRDVNFDLISPRKNNLNCSVFIDSVACTSGKTVEKPLRYINALLGVSNYTVAGFTDSSLILKGTCPYGVTTSKRKIALNDVVTNYGLFDGIYPYTFISSDTTYSGWVEVTGDDVNILPDANQLANFEFNVILPAQLKSKSTS